jgi:hypothetical protein
MGNVPNDLDVFNSTHGLVRVGGLQCSSGLFVQLKPSYEEGLCVMGRLQLFFLSCLYDCFFRFLYDCWVGYLATTSPKHFILGQSFFKGGRGRPFGIDCSRKQNSNAFVWTFWERTDATSSLVALSICLLLFAPLHKKMASLAPERPALGLHPDAAPVCKPAAPPHIKLIDRIELPPLRRITGEHARRAHVTTRLRPYSQLRRTQPFSAQRPSHSGGSVRPYGAPSLAPDARSSLIPRPITHPLFVWMPCPLRARQCSRR